MNVVQMSEAVRAMLRVQGAFTTAESFKKALNFKPSSTDVMISTPPKSGTTWVQQVCHGLRSRGDMNFDEINSVSPYIEVAHDAGYEDLQKPQPFSPRMFKTHLPCHLCPKGAGKYIVVVRCPSNAAVSLYHFLSDWVFSKAEVSVDECTANNFLKRGEPGELQNMTSHFGHIASWYPRRLDKDVLWLHYEDLQQDLAECVRLVARFLDIGTDDEELLKLVTHQAGFEFMKQHAAQFDDRALKLRRNEAVGLPREAGLKMSNAKIRNGAKRSSDSTLSPHIHAAINQKWTDIITAQTGYKDYDSFRSGINKELKRTFLH